MRSRVFGFFVLSVSLTGCLLGCGKTPPAADPKPTAITGPDPNVDVGNLLYASVAPPTYAGVGAYGEQVIIPNCTVQYEERQTISAEVDGILELFATPAKPGEK